MPQFRIWVNRLIPHHARFEVSADNAELAHKIIKEYLDNGQRGARFEGVVEKLVEWHEAHTGDTFETNPPNKTPLTRVYNGVESVPPLPHITLELLKADVNANDPKFPREHWHSAAVDGKKSTTSILMTTALPAWGAAFHNQPVTE